MTPYRDGPYGQNNALVWGLPGKYRHWTQVFCSDV